MRRLISIDGTNHDCEVAGGGGLYLVTTGGVRFTVHVSRHGEGFTVTVNDHPVAMPLNSRDASKTAAGETVTVSLDGREVDITCAAPAHVSKERAAGHHHSDPGTISAMMPGTIVKVLKSAGDRVAKGEVLLVLEAMKMGNEVLSPVGGTVEEVLVKPGKAVVKGEVLMRIRTAEAGHG
jgi:biotin carboxyl carrier protein